MESLGRNDFARIRIGIGRPEFGDVTNHVLGTFTPPEMDVLARVLDGGLDLLECALDNGVAKAMSLGNNKNFLEG